jgi:hypothetical protein
MPLTRLTDVPANALPDAPRHTTYDFVFATSETIENSTPCRALDVTDEERVPLANALARINGDLASVDGEDLSILHALANHSGRRLSRRRIARETKDPRLCERTVATRLVQLVNDGLIVRPRGPRSGYVITAAGRARLESISRE